MNWKTPTEFPFCPPTNIKPSLKSYHDNLEVGKPFSHDNYNNQSYVVDYGINEEEKALYVMTFKGDGLKHYGLCKIFIEDGIYYHESVTTYWEECDAKHGMASALGQEWNGAESIEDYC